jgi:hypothetical protein
MTRSSMMLTILFFLAVVLLVLWFIFRSPDCHSNGAIVFQVGDAQYRIPAWMDPYPSFDGNLPGLEKSSHSQRNRGFSDWCQSTSTSVIKVRGFGFSARPRQARSEFPMNTPGIVRKLQLSPAVRPLGNPLNWRDIRSSTYERRIVSADGDWASIFFTLDLGSGQSRRLEARCMYGVRESAEQKRKEYVQRCSTYVPLERQNALEVNVNPGEDPAAIGHELIQSLKAVEIMSRPN